MAKLMTNKFYSPEHRLKDAQHTLFTTSESARAIPKVKGNHKQSHSDLSCTLCNSKEEMNQEHLETCEGTEYERRGLDMGTWRGLLDFWRRMMKKLGATEA